MCDAIIVSHVRNPIFLFVCSGKFFSSFEVKYFFFYHFSYIFTGCRFHCTLVMILKKVSFGHTSIAVSKSILNQIAFNEKIIFKKKNPPSSRFCRVVNTIRYYTRIVSPFVVIRVREVKRPIKSSTFLC